MPRKIRAIDKKKDPVRLTPVQDRKIERAARYFQDHRDQWPGFVGLGRAVRLGIDLAKKPSRQALWIIALDGLLVRVKTFRERD